MKKFDFIVIGSGIIGVSVAYHLKIKNPKAKIVLLEKEKKPFYHQTSHNSGVIHAGVYYKPGSLKSQFCIQGLKNTYDFCNKNNIKYNKCGKLIAAASHDEITDLYNLYENSDKNDLNLKLLSKKQLAKKEPNLNSIEAIFSPNTGIIDWSNFANCMLEKFTELGGHVFFNYEVKKIKDSNGVDVNKGLKDEIYGNKLISCSGLQSDRLLNISGVKTKIKIIPFRGDYFLLDKKFNNLFNHLIYPVPNPKLPFLGIHFTKTIDGSLILGPNASINFSREDYDRFSVNLADVSDYLFFYGFWKLLYKYKKYIIKELLSSFSKNIYLSHARKYYEDLHLDDLLPFRAGIRAQAVDSNGNLIHDFAFDNTKNCLFVLNAPSPAATSSIPIGDYISDMIHQVS